MLANLSKRENVAAWLRTIDQYPLQLLQCMTIEERMLLTNIGALEFDALLAELSFCARNGLEIDPDWEVRVRRGSAVRDADSVAAVFLFYNKAMETARSINPKFFPYAITRTPAANVICYNRLQGMHLAEYAAELIDSTYQRPKYLRLTQYSSSDAIERLVSHAPEVSY